jgi:hypothetical protein
VRQAPDNIAVAFGEYSDFCDGAVTSDRNPSRYAKFHSLMDAGFRQFHSDTQVDFAQHSVETRVARFVGESFGCNF